MKNLEAERDRISEAIETLRQIPGDELETIMDEIEYSKPGTKEKLRQKIDAALRLMRECKDGLWAYLKEGEYEKQTYIVKTKDGKIFECWPNAGVMNDLGGSGRRFRLDEVTVWMTDYEEKPDGVFLASEEWEKMKEAIEFYHNVHVRNDAVDFNTIGEPARRALEILKRAEGRC
jgi:hypothetical protein